MTETNKPNNRLLTALPAKDYQFLLSNLEKVSLTYAEIIYNPGDVIHHIYFPESGIISLLSSVGENSTLEVGIVGNEGMIGLPVFLGIETSNNRALVQGAGSALRITAKDFLEACDQSRELRQIIQRFTHSLITQISQSAACYRFHPIEARLARWLLMTSDRMESDEFHITQEFLSNMLGVRREGVNKSATYLQKSNLISYKRGEISILNRVGLEATACRCYFILKEEYESDVKLN